MKKKITAKTKTAFPGTYKLILVLSVILALSSIFVVLRLQNQMNQIVLQEQVLFMQK